MRQRDFERIAGAIKAARDSACLAAPHAADAVTDLMDSLAGSMADTLARQNGRFNRVRFLHGCGVSEKYLKKDLTRLGVLL